MAWKPGMPVVTIDDHAQWQQWRCERKREQQRLRRANNRRIDYYPDKAAAKVIDAQWRPAAGHDISSIINRIIQEWSQQSFGIDGN